MKFLDSSKLMDEYLKLYRIVFALICIVPYEVNDSFTFFLYCFDFGHFWELVK